MISERRPTSGPPPRVVVGDPEVLSAPPGLLGSAAQLRPLDARQAWLVERIAAAGVVAHGALVLLFTYGNVGVLAGLNMGAVVGFWFARRASRRHQRRAAAGLLSLVTVVHAVAAVAFLGWGSGFQYYLLPLIPFFMLGDRLSRAQLVLIVASVTGVLLVLVLAFDQPVLHLPSGWVRGFSIVNLGVPTAALGSISYYHRRASMMAEDRMERLATRDPLTSLLNRRAMRERLVEEQQRSERSGDRAVLVLADIDHFKRINDTFGHDAGDDVLVDIARLLKEGLRQEDIVSRWGGEEFLMLLPGTTLGGAGVVTERLREQIARHEFAIGSTIQHITLTFGVAEFERGFGMAASIRLADEALYAGKASGRNRVVTKERTH